ncbi:uncharacterized protein JCM15063_004382 [Sporobolomyces koalae]|uniref:uncharacterized protein n=1 Tax=Sporobolomyces koalae TaxID=500713 RepID=UPI00317A102E
MVQIAALAAIVATTFASLSSAISVPTTDTISFTAPVTPNHLERRGLINLGALVGKGSLIELDVLANILGPNQCTGNAVVGIQASIQIGHLLSVCACVEVLGSRRGVTPCPACPVNARPICGSGSCGCECNDGYYSNGSGVCVPESGCTSSGGRVRHHRDGSSECVCPSPLITSTQGTCVLPPSARARAARNKARSQLALDYPAVEGDEFKCPDGERACPLGDSNGYECLDVTSTLDSCGGCPGTAESVNCLALPGAAGVSCSNSQCQVASCFPGWRYLNGRCHRMD